MDKYAVIQIKSKQYFVKEGDKIVSHPLTKEDSVQLLLIKDKDLLIGEPELTLGGVTLSYIEDKTIKTEVRRYRSKSRYRKNRSHSQAFSYLRVDVIDSSLKQSSIVFEKQEEPKKVKKIVKKTPVKKVISKKSTK